MAKILIVDDQPKNRQYLVDLLSNHGHNILEAGDGIEALERVRAEHPDLVITDILMPTMDGYEFVRQLRSDPAIAMTPVIFHSAAYQDLEMWSLASACGVSHILRKPAQPKTLLNMVGVVLGSTQLTVPDLSPSGEFDREHLRLLTDKLSEKADAFEKANARLNMLIELGKELGLDQEREHLLEHACRGAQAIIDAKFAALGVIDKDVREFRYHFQSGCNSEDVAHLVRPSPQQGFLSAVLEQAKLIRVDRPSGALLGVPIASPTSVYGVLYFIDKRGAAAFTEQDERLAATIASTIAIAYENTKRREDLECQAAVLRQEVIDRQRSEEQVRALNEDLENRVRERTTELSRSNTELEQFAYVAAHDLQEPLRKVVGFTQLLAEHCQGRLDSDADEFISYAVDGATRMQQLIRELLAYSRVGAGDRVLRPIDCERVLECSLANLQATLDESRAVVTHEPLPTVIADEGLLVQVLQNLIGNAVKFKGTETPRVHIKADRQVDQWAFSVRDNGIGIDPQFKERIFEIFQRLHNRTAFPGTGIGLAICKKAIERHGGRIWVDSETGEGASFHFTIPDRREPREAD